MDVQSIGGLTSTPQSTQVNSLGLDDFLRILMTQLTYQDPLKPLDNQEFIAQLAQFTSLQQSREVNQGIQQLLTIQSATQSVGLLGRTVQVRTADDNSVIGVATTLRFNSGQPLLTVRSSDGSYLADMPLSQVMLVQ